MSLIFRGKDSLIAETKPPKYIRHMALTNLDYELIDFGNGRKLERFGEIVTNRPEILAKGPPKLSKSEWQKRQNAYYNEKNSPEKVWDISKPGSTEQWNCVYKSEGRKLKFNLHFGKHKHVGLFPEQEANWRYLATHSGPGSKLLNLFAYTGASSLVAAASGAKVVHVDASKSIIKAAKENGYINNLQCIHWINDDALRFIQREARRGNSYDFIIMDPPVFGITPKGEKWKLEKSLPELVRNASQILSTKGVLICNTYSPRLSLENMRSLTNEAGLHNTKSGWLSVIDGEKRKLSLSKYVYSIKK